METAYSNIRSNLAPSTSHVSPPPLLEQCQRQAFSSLTYQSLSRRLLQNNKHTTESHKHARQFINKYKSKAEIPAF